MPKMVRGIITQGARGLEGSAENRAFVRKYKLAHSSNGKDWTYITDSKTGFAKVEENTHSLLVFDTNGDPSVLWSAVTSHSFAVIYSRLSAEPFPPSPSLSPRLCLFHSCHFSRKRRFITASAPIIIQFNHLARHSSCFCVFLSPSPALSLSSSLILYLSLMGVN